MKKTCLLFMTWILAGCTTAGTAGISPNKESDISSSKEDKIMVKRPVIDISSESLTDFENLFAASSSVLSLFPAGDGDKIYQLGTAVKYCDPSVSSLFSYYCSDSNCKHIDETCPAYIGDAEKFIAYKGLWYYDLKNDAGKYEIICHNPDTNERNVIATYEEGTVNSMIASHHSLYVEIVSLQNGMGELQKIDLTTLEKKTILEDYMISFAGTNGNKAVVVHSEIQGKDNIKAINELRIYDLNDTSYVSVLSSDQGLKYPNSYSQMIKGNEVIYSDSKTIHILNLNTMEDNKIYTSDSVGVSWFFGNKVCFLENKDNEVLAYMMSNDGSDKYAYPEWFENNSLNFSAKYLTEHGQIIFSNKDGWISENDFLNGNINQIINI